MLGPCDYIILQVTVKRREERTVACHADHQVFILLRLFLSLLQYIRVDYIKLDMHSF